MKQWCDVQDQDGNWRIGYMVHKENNILRIRLDGHAPSFDIFYCKHSKKLFPVRTYTFGLNPQLQSFKKTLRQPLTLNGLQMQNNRLQLFNMKQSQLENTEDNIKIFMRTELLILIDTIIKTPFDLINQIKMCDLWINKIFIGVINFYVKILDASKKYFALFETNARAKQLYYSMFQLSQMIKMIIGSHKNSKSFFQDQQNLTIKAEGFVECFIKCQGVFLLFKMFFKNASTIKNLGEKQLDVALEVISLYLDCCQISKGVLFQSAYLSQIKLVLDEIINYLKKVGEDQYLSKVIRTHIEIISRIQTLQIKIKPNKTGSILRNSIMGQKKKMQPEIQSQKHQPMISDQVMIRKQQLSNLEERVKKLENFILNLQIPNQKNQENQVLGSSSKDSQLSIQNLGQQTFLSSLQWALQTGDINTCRKLVSWRQNLLRLGRIAGWKIALQVGKNTFQKGQISYDDIISANHSNIYQTQNKNIKLSQTKPFQKPKPKQINKILNFTPANFISRQQKENQYQRQIPQMTPHKDNQYNQQIQKQVQQKEQKVYYQE